MYIYGESLPELLVAKYIQEPVETTALYIPIKYPISCVAPRTANQDRIPYEFGIYSSWFAEKIPRNIN